MPRLAWLVACGLAALATVPAGEAVGPSVRLYGVLQAEVPIFTLKLEADPDPGPTGALPSLGPYCNRASFVPDEEGRAFTFQESEQEAGCLEVVHELDVPAGTQEIEVSFLANRSVRQRQLPEGAPIHMVQVLYIRTDGDTDHLCPIYEPNDPSRPEPRQFRCPYTPRDVESVQLVWSFEDMGPVNRTLGSQRPSSTGAFSATVQNPRVNLDGIPLPVPPVATEQGRLEDQDYVARFAAEVRIPSGFLAAAAAGQFAMRLEMDDVLETLLVQAPDGNPLPRTGYETATSGGVTTLTIPAATVQQYASFGDRPFLVQLERVEPLQPHATFTFLSYVALGAPAIAIGAAWFALRRTELDTGLEGKG